MSTIPNRDLRRRFEEVHSAPDFGFPYGKGRGDANPFVSRKVAPLDSIFPAQEAATALVNPATCAWTKSRMLMGTRPVSKVKSSVMRS